VIHSRPDPVDDDSVWRALANSTRRRILDVLRAGPRTTGDVVDEIGQERHITLQHLAVLRTAGLVTVERQGRLRINHLNPIPIQMIHERWVSQYEANWLAALVGLKTAVEGKHRPTEEGREVG
jgi:DNA-binding transcriptional ArsR family regulator